MQETATSLFSAWESFYVIVGSSAAALTGLQFVVMALITETQARGGPETIAAFGTPTIVHFCAVLLVSAVLSAPWHSLAPVAWVLGGVGAAGVGYAILVALRARRQPGYTPVFEDWLFHAILPLIAYGTLLGAAAEMLRDSTVSLFGIASMALLLLFVGIHNAWDTATYITAMRVGSSPEGG